MPFLAPLIPAAIAFAASPLGGAIIGIGISLAVSLLQGMLAPKQKKSDNSLVVQIGDDYPLSFTIGYAATAGTLRYIGSWGQTGKTPNAYLVKVVQIGDMPIATIDGIWMNGAKVTLGPTAIGQGFPILEARVDGVDYAWISFRTGDETTVNTYLNGKFGTHPTRPWGTTFIGRGTPHAIITVLFNRELWKNEPEFLFEPGKLLCYDPRLDSTNGGVGTHVWGNRATYAPSENLPVLIYNIIRGIYYGSEWVYGGYNLPAFRFPSSSWFAAMNAADAAVTLIGGGTEPAYRGGLEIQCNTEALTVIEQLLEGCNARLVEIGGRFEISIGAPGAAVYAFSDDGIVITDPQQLDPFPSLQQTHNGIEATYPEPAEQWKAKDAPPRYNATWEALDGARRLATGIQFEAVPYANQVQRLMEALIGDDRRFRIHVITLPPNAWALTPGSVVAWTSGRNGYSNKSFTIIRASGKPGMNQIVTIREVDASDFSWTIAKQLPIATGLLVLEYASPQLTTGIVATGVTIVDSAGVARRPTVNVAAATNLDDVRSVRIQMKLKSTDVIAFDGNMPYVKGDLTPNWNLPGSYLPNAIYSVRALYTPYSGRVTRWSNQDVNGNDGPWQDVTTPDVRQGYDDFRDDVLLDYSNTRDKIRGIQYTVRNTITKINDFDFANARDHSNLRTFISATFNGVTASYENLIDVAVSGLDNQISGVDSNVSALSKRVEKLDITIPTLATLGAVNSLTLRVDENENGLNAISQAFIELSIETVGGTITALNALEVRVTSTEGVNTTQGNSINAINLVLPNKADLTVTDALDIRTDETESSLIVQGATLRDVKATVKLDVIKTVDQDFFNFLDKRGIREIVSNVYSYSFSNIEVLNGSVSSLSQQMIGAVAELGKAAVTASSLLELIARVGATPAGYTSLSSAILDTFVKLDGKATGNALLSLDTRVGTTPAGYSSVAGAVLGAFASIGTLQTGKADASALTALDTRVGTTPAGYTSFATALTAVNVSLNDMSADALVKFETGYTPATGFTARVGIEARVTTAGVWRSAGIYIDVAAASAQIVLEATTVKIINGATAVAPFIVVAGVVQMQNVLIKDAIIETLNGTKLFTGSVDTLQIANNAVSISASATAADFGPLTATLATPDVIFTHTITVKAGRAIIIFKCALGTRLNNINNYGTYTFSLKVAGVVKDTHAAWYDEQGGTQYTDGMVVLMTEISGIATGSFTYTIESVFIGGAGQQANAINMRGVIINVAK